MGISLTGCTDADGRWTIAPTVWWALMYAALLSSVLCSGIITWANKRTSATYVTSFYPLQVCPALPDPSLSVPCLTSSSSGI